MNKILLFTIFIALTMNLIAQSDYESIDRDGFYIIQTGSEKKSSSKTKASGLKSTKIAEEQFGKNNKVKREFGEMSEEYSTVIEYKDGLELRIPEN